MPDPIREAEVILGRPLTPQEVDELVKGRLAGDERPYWARVRSAVWKHRFRN